MASPIPGMSPQQTQEWVNKSTSDMRARGQNPAWFGFGNTHDTGQPQPTATPQARQTASQPFGAWNQGSQQGFNQWSPQSAENSIRQLRQPAGSALPGGSNAPRQPVRQGQGWLVGGDMMMTNDQYSQYQQTGRVTAPAAPPVQQPQWGGAASPPRPGSGINRPMRQRVNVRRRLG